MATRAATSGELAKFRADSQASKLYLAIRKPTTIYTAQLTTPLPTTTDMDGQINYTAGSGTLANVLVGMNMYVGTTAGGRELGVCRIRKTPTASIFYVGEESEINWLAGGTIYLTVVDEHGLWSKHIKIVSNVPYMDYDIAYSNQHTNFDPVVMMGPDVILWLTGATVSVTWNSASGSYDPSGVATISSYSWSAPGASATANMATSAPTITYNAAGQYKVYCTVTLSTGKSFQASRTVFVYSASSMPETNFKITSNPKGSYDDGGWKMEVEMYANADKTSVQDRTKVILFAKDYYNSVEGSIGPVVNCENIVMTGWIDGETIEWNADKTIVRFTISGAHEWLKKMPGFTLGLQNKWVTPTAWTDMQSLTPRKMLWHLLHWRSTADAIMDCDITTDARLMQAIDLQQGSLWSQLIAAAHTTILADPIVDRLGGFYCHVNLPYVPTASRSSFPVVMTLQTNDWQDTMNIIRTVVPKTSRVELSGVSLSVNSEPKAIFSLAPGHVFKRYGEIIPLDYLVLQDQSQANTLAGMVLGYAEKEFDFEFTLAENNRLIDLAPRSFLSITVNTSDTIRGISYSGHIIVREIEIAYNENGTPSISIRAEQETFNDIAVNGDVPSYPAIPPIPPLPLPPPLPNPAPGPTVNPGSAANCIVYLTGSGFWYTKNFNSSFPNWFRMVDGLDSAHYLNMYGLGITKTGIVFSQYWDAASGGAFYSASAIGGTWALSPYGTAAAVVDDPDGYPFERGEVFTGWGLNPTADNSVCIVGSAIYTIFSTCVAYGFLGTTGGIGRTGPGGGVLGISGSSRQAMLKFNADNSYVLTCWGGPLMACRMPGGIFTGQNPTFIGFSNGQHPVLNQTMVPINAIITRSNPPYLSKDAGASFTQLIGGPKPYTDNVGTEACSANTDGTVLMVGQGDSSGGPQGVSISTDSGVTWALNAGIGSIKTPCTYFVGKDAGSGSNYFAACPLGAIKVTADIGLSWIDHTGDLATQAGASFVVGMMRVY